MRSKSCFEPHSPRHGLFLVRGYQWPMCTNSGAFVGLLGVVRGRGSLAACVEQPLFPFVWPFLVGSRAILGKKKADFGSKLQILKWRSGTGDACSRPALFRFRLIFCVDHTRESTESVQQYTFGLSTIQSVASALSAVNSINHIRKDAKSATGLSGHSPTTPPGLRDTTRSQTHNVIHTYDTACKSLQTPKHQSNKTHSTPPIRSANCDLYTRPIATKQKAGVGAGGGNTINFQQICTHQYM